MSSTRASLVILGVLLIGLPATASLAQQVPGSLPPPDLQNRIPAPLPPPERPLAVPLDERPPRGGVYRPPRLNTHSDRTRDCVQQGASAGLRGEDLDAYTRRCAN